eukprot:6175408-Pleurochrysis_carterae.AAC.1
MTANIAAEAVRQRRCAAAVEQSRAWFGPTMIGTSILGIGLVHRKLHHPGEGAISANRHPFPDAADSTFEAAWVRSHTPRAHVCAL